MTDVPTEWNNHNFETAAKVRRKSESAMKRRKDLRKIKKSEDLR
jgi:hypothetical protein